MILRMPPAWISAPKEVSGFRVESDTRSKRWLPLKASFIYSSAWFVGINHSLRYLAKISFLINTCARKPL